MHNTYEKFLNSRINEAIVPVIKLDHVLDNVPLATDVHRKVLVTHYKTPLDYIVMVDKKKHIVKINDLSGDIMNNNRVSFNVMIFSEDDIKLIKENIIKIAISEIYTELPEQLNIFGVDIKLALYIDKEELKNTFNELITIEYIAKEVLSQISKYRYVGKFYDFHIFSTQ